MIVCGAMYASYANATNALNLKHCECTDWTLQMKRESCPEVSHSWNRWQGSILQNLRWSIPLQIIFWATRQVVAKIVASDTYPPCYNDSYDLHPLPTSLYASLLPYGNCDFKVPCHGGRSWLILHLLPSLGIMHVSMCSQTSSNVNDSLTYDELHFVYLIVSNSANQHQLDHPARSRELSWTTIYFIGETQTIFDQN